MQLGFLTDGRVEDVVFANEQKFDCLELALFGDTPLFQDHDALKQALAERGVCLAAVSLFGLNYFTEDAAEADRLSGLLRRAIELAAALGSPVLVAGTGTPPGGTEAQQISAAIERFLPVVAEAQSRSLKFAFYNCHWENVIDRPPAWELALPQMPGVGIKFDPSHPTQAGRDWKVELLAAGSRLMHAHAKDVLKVGNEFVADPNPGLGDIRWESFFGLLTHLNYQGAVCIEPHSAQYTGERRYAYLELSRRYLRQFFPAG
ncbi:MAG TPA: sugar phosphate isomerase/epimerase [Armatimonadota bacterium]